MTQSWVATQATQIDPRAAEQDRREKAQEWLDGIGVLALMYGIPAVSAVFLSVALPWWFA